MIPLSRIKDLDISPYVEYSDGTIALYRVNICLKLTPDELCQLKEALKKLGWVK